MRILMLTMDKRYAVSFYRAAGIVRDLEKKLHATIDVYSWADFLFDWTSLMRYDIVMLQRGFQGIHVVLCKKIKRLGIPLWLDFDDDLFNVPPENKAWATYNDPEVQKDIFTISSLADVISVTTEDLKVAFSKYNDNIVVIPNAFNDFMFDIDRVLPERNKTVLWRGSDTHVYDLMYYNAPLDSCIKEHQDHQFIFMGFNPWFSTNSPNLKFIKTLDIQDYFDMGIKIAPSVVHVPLHDNIFNRSKSNIAFIEGSYWGAICIIPEWWGKLPGTLTYNDVDSYHEAMEVAITNNPNQNKQSWDYIKKNLLASKVNNQRCKLIKSLI